MQSSHVCLLNCTLSFPELYVGASATGTVTLFNQTLLPSQFSWLVCNTTFTVLSCTSVCRKRLFQYILLMGNRSFSMDMWAISSLSFNSYCCFEQAELQGKQASLCSATFYPSSGTLGPKVSMEITVTFTAHTDVSASLQHFFEHT